jgi:hypothetical protein
VRALVLFVLITLLVVVGGVTGYFLVQNADWVVIRFPTVSFDWQDPFPSVEYETPLPLVMVACLGVGFLLAFLLFFPSWIRRAWERQRERRFVSNLEGELSDLRNMPVTDPAPLEDLPETPTGTARQRGDEEAQDEDQALLAAALRDADRAEAER